MKAMKNYFCVKDKGTIHFNTLSKWFEKFCLGCKNLDDQASLARLKTMDSKAVL